MAGKKAASKKNAKSRAGKDAKSRAGKKTSTSKKSLRARARKANKSCCPLIRVECYETYAKTKKPELHDGNVVVKTTRIPLGKKCNIIYGKKKYKRLDSADAGKKVAELRKELTAKRCMAEVKNSTKKERLVTFTPVKV